MEKIKLLLYCTKQKPTLYNVLGKYITSNYLGKDFMQNGIKQPELNGKIVAECDFEVEKIDLGFIEYEKNEEEYNKKIKEINDILHKSCLNASQIGCYLTEDTGYAIHIKNLHIFDKPRELNKCMSIKTFENEFVIKTLSPEMISKAPQNMMKVKMWVDGKEYGMWKNYVLISIRAEWLCKILNGEKTIEVRKKVLKEMIS